MENINSKLNKYEKRNLETSLIVSLNEALKNKEFYDFVSKLDMPKEELAKYTTTLEESSKEYGNCQNCKGLAMCKNRVNGYAFLPIKENNKLNFNYKACKYQNKLLKETSYLENVYIFDIPKEIREAKMKDVYVDDPARGKTIVWIKNFIKEYSNIKYKKGLYLNGNFGCGKTYLIAAMFNELAKSNIKSAIVFWPEFINDLKFSFSGNPESFKNKFNSIKKVPLLLIDDIGAENSTEWNRDEVLCPILQYRMEEHLPTFFTSNLNLEELETHLSINKKGVDVVKARRIVERVKQLTENLTMVSENLRK